MTTPPQSSMNKVNGWEQSVMEVYHYLHEHPEPGWEEFGTTQYLMNQFRNTNWQVKAWEGTTGFIIDLIPKSTDALANRSYDPTRDNDGTGAVPIIALRADLDALYQEVDGEWRANHSCGHDAHMAIVCGAALLLADDAPPGVGCRAIFQPAEELGEGALELVRRGALDNVQYLFGVHLRPDEELPNGVFSGAVRNGAALQLDGVITGEAAHGARPHQGVNPIEVLCALQQGVASIHVNPMVPHSAKLTKVMSGGKSTNVIPQTAEFTFDLRAQTNAVLNQLEFTIDERIRRISEAMGARAELTHTGRVMAAEVNEEARQILRNAIVAVAGETALAADVVTPGGEDFHYYTARRPQTKAAMLGVGCGLKPGLHHPHMTFNTSVIPVAARILATAVRNTGKRLQSVRN